MTLTPEEITTGWRTHDGGPCPIKDERTRVDLKLLNGVERHNTDASWSWDTTFGKYSIIAYRIIEAHGEDAKPADPYDALDWDEDGTAIVVHNGVKPDWVRDDDQVRFEPPDYWEDACEYIANWNAYFAFQIKRRPRICECCGQPVPNKETPDADT